MPGFSFQKGPDGKYVTTFDGPAYKGNEPLKSPGTSAAPAPVRRAGTPSATTMPDPGRVFSTFASMFGGPAGQTMPMILGGIEGAQTLMRTGDVGQAWKKGTARTASLLEDKLPTPLGIGPMTPTRIGYNATRNFYQSVLGNLPASGSRKPGQADSPILGFIPPLPKAKSTGPVEDMATDLLQTGMGITAAVVGTRVAGAALGAIPGGAAVLGGLSAAGRVPAALRTMAAATEGVGGVSGGLNAAANVARFAQIATEGAVVGGLANYAAFTPEEQTQADQWLGWAKGSNWLPLQEYIFSKPGDTDADARWKNAVFNLPLDASMNVGLHALGKVAKVAISRFRGSALEKVFQDFEAQRTKNPNVPAGQQTVDVTAQPVAEPVAPPAPAPAAPAPAAPAPSFVPVPPTPQQQARIDIAQQGYNTAKAKLDAIGPEPPKPSTEKVRFGPNGIAGADPAAVAKWKAETRAYQSWSRKYLKLKKEEVSASNLLFDAKKETQVVTPSKDFWPWNDAAPAPAAPTAADVNRAIDNAATKLAHLSETVPTEMGPVTPETRGSWRPSFNQVQERSVSDLSTDPQRLQYKEAGRLAEGGVTGTLKGVDVYNPFLAKPISVWTDPVDGKLYVVNGHNQLDLAKRAGAERVLTWEIQASTAEEARAIGAIENMAAGQGTALDAAKVIRDMGITGEELINRGVDLNAPMAKDAIALAQLPQQTFNKVVAGKLDLAQAIELGNKELTPEVPAPGTGAITPEVLPPGGMPQRESDTPIADKFKELIERMAQSDAGMFRTLGEMSDLTKQAINELGGEVTPAASATPALTAAPAPTTAPPAPAPALTQPPAAPAPTTAPPAPAPALTQPPAPAATPAELPDTRGQGQFFHGSSTPIKELKAESDVPGITPESGTLEIIYQTATTKGKNIYGQGFYVTDDLKTASSYQKKGTGTAPVVYQIKERNPDLRFYDLDQQIGKDAVDDIFAETPGMAKEQVYNAVDDGLMKQQYQSLGQALDLIRKANGALRSQDVFDAIKEYLTTQGYGGFTHQGGNLAGGGERLHQVRIYWDPAKDLTIEKYTPTTPAAPTAPAAPANLTIIPLTGEPLETVVPQMVADEIQIPPGASRPLPPGSPRIDTVSQSIARWLGTSQDEARNMLLAKGAVLDVTKVPGIDLEKALNDAAMGMTSPETQAITRAYQQFYGPSSQQQEIARLSIANAVDDYMPDRLPDSLRVSPEVTQAVQRILVKIVETYAGPDVAVIFQNGMKTEVDYGGHGKAGELVEVLGGYDVNIPGVMNGDPVKEVILFTKMGMKDYRGQTDLEFFNARASTAYHEIFHVIQERYLSSKQLEVVNNVFARVKLAMAHRNLGGGDVPLERQAQGWEGYMAGVYDQVSPSLTMLGFPPSMQQEVMESAATGEGRERLAAMFTTGFFKAIEILDNLANFIEKIYNAITIKQWSSLRDIYAQAAAGKIQAEGVSRGNVFAINDLPGKVTDFMKYKEGDPEWALRVKQLIEQDVVGGEKPSRGEFVQKLGRREMMRANRDDLQARPQTMARLQTAPPTPPMPDGPGDESWATRFARVLADNEAALKSGDITMEELYVLNRMQKTESPSGSRVYTTESQKLIPGYAAMSQVLPDRPTATGYPIFNGPEIVTKNQAWYDSHGRDGKLIMAGLGSLQQGFRGHEMGALNRAMAYADMLQKEAQIQAAQWLNSVGSGTVNKSERLTALITAADNARRIHLAIANVTRPWGQLGAEMQLPRDYQVPANVIETPAGVEPPPSMIEQQISQELAQGDANPNAVFEEITDVLDPELTHAAKGGEITPQAEAAADVLAEFINSGGVDPTIRTGVWQDLANLSSAKPGIKAGVVGATGDNPLTMLRVNSLLSSGETSNVNFINGLFNIARFSVAHGVGALVERDLDRALYSATMFSTAFANIPNALRLAGHAIKTGKPLFNLKSGVVENYQKMAAQDAQGNPLPGDPNAKTGWTLTTMNLGEQFAKTSTGQALNWLWGTVGTGASRLIVGLDTFNATLAGHAFEHFNHLPRGMELAVENGLQKYTPEAFAYATNYAKARVKASLQDAIINGKTIADAVMTSKDAQKFMDAVNFTEDLRVKMEPRTLAEGMRLGESRGLKGDELTKYAQEYVNTANWEHKVATMGHDRLGKVANVPGELLNMSTNVPLVGPIFVYLQPFLKVPGNMFKEAFRSTPGLNLFVDSFYRDIMSENPAIRQRANGEWLLGGAVIATAIAATAMGQVRNNGNGPTDPIARENWLKDRKMPNSIQFWDESIKGWGPAISMRAFEPYSTLLSAIGDYNDVAAGLTTEQRTRLGSALVFDVLRMQALGLLNKSYFQGINELYQAAFDPSKVMTGPSSRNSMTRLLERVVASMQPWSSAMRSARRQVDPIARSVDPAETGNFAMDFFKETMDEIRNQNPGLSFALAGRRDWSLPGAPYMTVPQILGSEAVRDNPFLVGSMQFTPFSIMRVSDGPTDPVQREMSTLYGKGTAFSGPRAADFGPELRLTPTELSEYQLVFGTVRDTEGFTWYERMSQMINSPNYAALPYEAPSSTTVSERAARIQVQIEKFKKLAKEEYKLTTEKGRQITAEQLRAEQRQQEVLFGRQYGTSNAPQPGGAERFVREMNP